MVHRAFVGVFGVVAITTGAKVAFEAYRSSSKQLGAWEDRSAALHGDATKCNSCAVVIPSDKLTGKGFGSAIDEPDCVVRFNAQERGSTRPSEDWGTKDDIRVVNAYQIDALQDKGGSCIDAKHPTCRRVIITWETGGADAFLDSHENAELLPQMDNEYYPPFDGKPDVHDTLRDFANENGLGVPMYGSSAYCAISVLKHPDVCGEEDDHLRRSGFFGRKPKGTSTRTAWRTRALLRHRARVFRRTAGMRGRGKTS